MTDFTDLISRGLNKPDCGTCVELAEALQESDSLADGAFETNERLESLLYKCQEAMDIRCIDNPNVVGCSDLLHKVPGQVAERVAALEHLFTAAGTRDIDRMVAILEALPRTADGVVVTDPTELFWWDGQVLLRGAGCATEYLTFPHPDGSGAELQPHCGIAGCYSSEEAALAAQQETDDE